MSPWLVVLIVCGGVLLVLFAGYHIGAIICPGACTNKKRPIIPSDEIMLQDDAPKSPDSKGMRPSMLTPKHFVPEGGYPEPTTTVS